MPEAPPAAADLAAALRLFDETTRVLESRSRRLEEVLTVKQAELTAANAQLAAQLAELDDLRSYLTRVVDTVASGVVAVDAAGRITTANPVARIALHGLLGEVVVGADYRAALPGDPLWQVLASGQPAGPYQRTVPGPAGRGERILAGRAAPLLAADGAVLGLVESFEDVTGLRRLEEQLARSERLRELGELAAGVAHEIRNPLTGIEGFASLLARDQPPESSGRRYAQAIIEASRHLNRTVGDLLAFARTPQPVKSDCNPVALAESCLELVRAQELAQSTERGRQGGQERLSLPVLDLHDAWGDSGVVSVDAGQVRQVLLNLVQNACQILAEHRPGAGRVRLGVVAEPEQVLWQVDDDGPGVPPIERLRLFTPFQSKRPGGTGLGLAVAHTLVQGHGGSLAVGDAPGGGARFTVALPR